MRIKKPGLRQLGISLVALAGLILLKGCAADRAAPALPAQEPDIVISMAQGDAGTVNIAVTARGQESGQTTFTMGAFFGGTPVDPAWFQALGVACAAGCDATFHDSRLQVEVTHTPGDAITVSYKMDRSEEATDVDDYRPYAGANGFHLFSPLALILPTSNALPSEVRVRIEWSGAHPLFGPFGPVDDAAEGTLRRDELYNLLLASSPSYAIVDDDNGKFGAISYDPPVIEPDDVLARMAPLVSETREMFPETDEAWYFVTAQIAGEEIENGFALGGTALRSAFALYASPGMSFDQYGHVLDGIIAHEYFHNWNGILFFISGDDEHGARWFVEGFTDFYTRRIAHRAGVWSDQQAVQHLNEQIEYFNTSPARTASAAEIKAMWQAGHPSSDISYKRGDLLAFAIDEEVRRVSRGALNLDDMMRDFAARARAGAPPNVDDVYAWIAEHTTADFAAEIERIVVNGGPVPLPPSAGDFGAVLAPSGDKYLHTDG